MTTLVFTTTVRPDDVHIEDSGQSRTTELQCTERSKLFVRLLSWDEDRKHAEFNTLIGQRVRVTIETY